ncbi:hypothetical protein QJU43_01880 [Pasteurella atlantica]|uniref:hypothetical protein n=1 Tax=Pasteurellaceae TaxID=712 RepID=UPI00274F14A3|nr:hypothetical protein [Pasteurella atlantica]MDP8033039.1 hypothetical protein [Pasteurella atlantica]MDP8034976.1 hypothetical protein [Pasteurella atlantica]MDP8037064.1 hypothetical protein [Pasteurella atlantica]MDP8047410.1 hypothetical protein [Pasteurella atlantica]MDP8049079.1 hypothetical protein [Pasteurella atlantica]
MKSIMTKQETIRSENLFHLLEDYSEDLPQEKKESILEQVNKIAVMHTDIDTLDNYWCSMSLDEFCDSLAIQPIEVGTISEAEINEGLRLIWETEPPEQMYYLEKYTKVIEDYYKRSEGTISDMLFWSNYSEEDINTVINALKSNEELIFEFDGSVYGKSIKLQ